MNGSQLMGLDNVGTGIYAIHGYFHELTIGQRTPRFLGCHSLNPDLGLKFWTEVHDCPVVGPGRMCGLSMTCLWPGFGQS